MRDLDKIYTDQDELMSQIITPTSGNFPDDQTEEDDDRYDDDDVDCYCE